VQETVPVGSIQTGGSNVYTVASTSGGNITNQNFANFQLISISGTKFQDSNGNGVRNGPGEPGLQGFTIFLDTNNNGVLDTGEKRTVTGANGNFSFSNLGPGTYIVREVGQTNFVQMTINPAPISATSGGNVSSILIGNIPLINVITVNKLLLTGKNLTNLRNGTLGRQANFVANLYQTLLHRAPDLNGLAHYLRLFMAGYSEKRVTAVFKADFKLPATPVTRALQGTVPAQSALLVAGSTPASPMPQPLAKVHMRSSQASQGIHFNKGV